MPKNLQMPFLLLWNRIFSDIKKNPDKMFEKKKKKEKKVIGG